MNRLFTFRFGDEVIVSVHNLLILGKDSEPEPDLAILKPRSDFYAARHPGPYDVHLIVEAKFFLGVHEMSNFPTRIYKWLHRPTGLVIYVTKWMLSD